MEPLTSGAWATEAQQQLQKLYPAGLDRVSFGRKSEPPASSLPTFAPPKAPPKDPLAVIAAEKEKQQKERRRLRRLRLGLPEEK